MSVYPDEKLKATVSDEIFGNAYTKFQCKLTSGQVRSPTPIVPSFCPRRHRPVA